jgi:hypothetical protein
MDAIGRALKRFLDARPADVDIAVVGGLAISARTEPRFTRDLDFAVAVANDDDAMQYVYRLGQLGYQTVTVLQRKIQQHLSTVRLRQRGRGPLIDLLFAASGIEVEVVKASEPMEIIPGLIADVAQVGHLMAMKLVSRDDEIRPQDRIDLLALAKVANATEWVRARDAIRLITARGFARNRDLQAALAEWQRLATTIES